MSELLSGQIILSGYVPAVLDGHFRSARRRFRKVDNFEITDGEEAQILLQYAKLYIASADNNIQLPKTDIVVKTGFLAAFLWGGPDVDLCISIPTAWGTLLGRF